MKYMTCFVYGLTLTMVQTHANAQTVQGSSTGLEEVIVTARKRVENIQSVPISVTALSGSELANQNAREVRDIALTVPNISIQASSGNLTAPTYTIRGQVQNDTTAAIDPSVGMYVDGVYWARAYGSNASLLDIARVEVLKGPQGTLFGRNTTGGAINIVTQDPTFDSFNGSLTASYGNQEEFDFNAVGNLPLIDDQLAARLAVGHQENGGWVDNEFTGKDMLSSDQWIGRGKVLWTPVEKLRVLFSAEYFDYDGVGPANKLVSITPFIPGVFDPFGAAQLEALLESGFTDDGTQYADGRIYDLALNQKPKTDTTTQTYSGTATLDTAWGTLKGIGAYRKVRTRSAVDNDGTPYQIFDVPIIASTVDQWSGELQASGNAYDDRLAWTVGAFYFTEDGYDDLAGIVVPFVLPQFRTLRVQGSDVENSSEAAYSQGTFKVTPELSVTLGLRYSVDRRHKRQYQEILDPTNPNCDPALTPESDLEQCVSPKFKRKDSATNYTFSVDYKLTPDMMIYAKTARGFRAGGFNSRQGADQEDGGSFGPETVTDYEVGFKSQLFEDRARFNTAIFYSDYEDIQSTLLTINPETNQPITLVQNAAKARIFGFEVEAEAILFTNFRLSAAAGYTDPEYKDFEDLSGDRSDEKFPLSPKWTASASAQYTNNLEVGRLLVRADYSWKDKIVFMQNLHPPFTEAKSYGVLNGRIALAFSDGKYEVAAYGRNLLDEDYKVFALDLESSGLGFISNQYGQPRQYGVEVSARFGQ